MQERVMMAEDFVPPLAANLNATVVIQHDLRDFARLPAFPASAH